MNCLHCNAHSENNLKYREHLKSHRYEKKTKFKCYQCGVILTNFKSFLKHCQRKHRVFNKNANKTITPDINFTCKICSHKGGDVKSHILLHLNLNQKIECPFCNAPKKLFKSKTAFNVHYFRNHRNIHHNETKNVFDPNENLNINEACSTPISIENQCTSSSITSPVLKDNSASFETNILGRLMLKLRAENGLPETTLMTILQEIEILKNEITEKIKVQVENFATQNNLSPELRTGLVNGMTGTLTSLDTAHINTPYKLRKLIFQGTTSSMYYNYLSGLYENVDLFHDEQFIRYEQIASKTALRLYQAESNSFLYSPLYSFLITNY
jgi:hypothetical protein